MSDIDTWIDLCGAVSHLVSKCGISPGRAQARLHELCMSGAIRSRGVSEEGWPGAVVAAALWTAGRNATVLRLMSGADWKERSINLDTNTLTGAPGRGFLAVAINERDLNDHVAPTEMAAEMIPRLPDQTAPPRRRGPKPSVSDRVTAAMRSDIEGGALKPNELDDMKGIGMASRYGACEKVCRAARETVLRLIRNN